MNRRAFAAALASSVAAAKLRAVSPPVAQTPPSNGRFVHGVTRNTFGTNPNWTMEEACRQVAPLGVKGFDFALPPDFPILKKFGMICSMYRPAYSGPPVSPPNPAGGRGGGTPPGWNAMGTPEAMGAYRDAILEGIDVAAANGIPNVILLAGSRNASLDYAKGADNAVAFCNAVKGRAEERGVTLCMELLNSKGLNAPAMSMFDRTSWGVDVCKRVNSPRVKILYDIFHAQIMEGFIVQTIRDNFQYIGHIHTGGVPGRHELDDTQELNYRFIARALADLNFTGFVTHEWTPTPGKDPIAGLRQAIEIMRV